MSSSSPSLGGRARVSVYRAATLSLVLAMLAVLAVPSLVGRARASSDHHDDEQCSSSNGDGDHGDNSDDSGDHGSAAPQTATMSSDHHDDENGDEHDDECGSVQVHKVDDAGAPLAGVTFSLWTNTHSHDMPDMPGEPVTPAQSCTTDAAGNCTITMIEEGKFWVVEGTPPDGHDGAAPQMVKIGDDDEDEAATTPVLTFIDQRQPAAVAITKTDDAQNPLKGAVFGLFTDDGGKPGAAVDGKTCTTGDDGTCSITNILPAGDYWVRETTTPDLYKTADDKPVTLTLGHTSALSFTDARKTAGMTTAKTVNGAHPSEAAPLVVEAGSTLQYVLSVMNTGELPLTITSLTDSLQTTLPAECTAAVGTTLDVGKTFTCSYTATADGPANNVATAAATDGFNRTTTASDGVFVAPIHPAMTLAKSASPTEVPATGGSVTYTYLVTNTGDVPLTDILVSDDKLGTIDTIPTLAPGGSSSLTKTVDVAGGSDTTNVGTASGSDPLGNPVTATSSSTVTSAAAPAPQTSRVLGNVITRGSAAGGNGGGLASTGLDLPRLLEAVAVLLCLGMILQLAALVPATIRRDNDG